MQAISHYISPIYFLMPSITITMNDCNITEEVFSVIPDIYFEVRL